MRDNIVATLLVKKGKCNVEHPYRDSPKALKYESHSFTCKLHHTYLYIVSVHRTAPPLIVEGDIELQLTTHLSTAKG